MNKYKLQILFLLIFLLIAGIFALNSFKIDKINNPNSNSINQLNKSKAYTIEGKQITFIDENISFEFPNGFEFKDQKILFGSEEIIPESPTDNILTKRVLSLQLLPSRSMQEIDDGLENSSKRLNNVFNTETLNLKNGMQFKKWEESALCSAKFYEIVGVRNNIRITNTACSNIELAEKEVQHFLDSLR